MRIINKVNMLFVRNDTYCFMQFFLTIIVDYIPDVSLGLAVLTAVSPRASM